MSSISTAPGVAALDISGRTLHSGFGLPLTGFAPLTGSRLANMQLLREGVCFVIIDEKSMLALRTLAPIDSRCRQLFPQNANRTFGNMNVALVATLHSLLPLEILLCMFPHLLQPLKMETSVVMMVLSTPVHPQLSTSDCSQTGW